jgi:phytoene synthase
LPAPADLTNLEGLYQEAAAATAAGSKSFYFATRFFPPELARSAHAVYWFCRTTDDLVDEAPSREIGDRDLAEWEQAVRAGFRGDRPQHPVLQAFFDAVRRHSIPSEYALDLIEGVRMDLQLVRYQTFDDLRVFCYRVASTVGLMMSKVIGFTRPDLEPTGIHHAIDLGIAMQLTNILRDVGTDLALGRIYLPAEDMERFGYREADLRAHRRNLAFTALMEFQIARAREYYQRAEPGIPMLDSRGRFAVKVAADVYRGILGVIERNGYDVFERRAVVPPMEKYWLSARSMAAPAARYSMNLVFSKLGFRRA